MDVAVDVDVDVDDYCIFGARRREEWSGVE